MTGLDPDYDLILEVAVIVTDWKFKEVARFESVIKNSDELMLERMAINGSFWNEFPDQKAKMVEQNQSGKTAAAVEKDLIDFIDEHFPADQPVLLAGNSIHMDRRFIISKWPKLEKRLHYRMLDVSAWKVVFENKLGHSFPKPEVHRAFDDIRGSIMELQHYLRYFK